ncbi:MAG TPA: DUF1232 domain-containing protein [Roseiflexaceae bacterium]|nr:DUF1232 domain-containing protein [Roseiflexaceae bacterium]HMP42277.1 DUF1232 domain-containing protein [Roseiflexaceae bacterium]
MHSSRTRRIGAVIGIICGAIYLIYPSASVFELIPDAIPFIGSLDEAGATALLLWGIQALRSPQAAALPAATPPQRQP